MRSTKLALIAGMLSLMLLSAGCIQNLQITEDSANTDSNNPTITSLPELDHEAGDNAAADSISEFFSTELQRSGVERVGQPIEGFNAVIYLEAFPGFEAADFNGVETLEGIYLVVGEELKYERTAGDTVTSAETTISGAGYKTLLENFSKRVGIEVISETDIALLLEKLHEADEFPEGFIFEDFSLWLPEYWYAYDLAYSVLFLKDPNFDLSSLGSTEGFAVAPSIQVIKFELSVEDLLDQNLWTDGSEFVVSKETVRIGTEEHLRLVTTAAGAAGQVLNYIFDAGDGRVFLVSTFPYESGSPDTDDFERAAHSFMINYVMD